MTPKPKQSDIRERESKKNLSEKQKIARATKIQNESYSAGVRMATEALKSSPKQTEIREKRGAR